MQEKPKKLNETKIQRIAKESAHSLSHHNGPTFLFGSFFHVCLRYYLCIVGLGYMAKKRIPLGT